MNKYFNNFLREISTRKLIEVGRYFGKPSEGNWIYTVGSAYNIRIYDRFLSDEEVRDNFVTSKSFHQSLLAEDDE